MKRSFVFLNSRGVREFTSRHRRFKLKLRHLNTSLGYFGLFLLFLLLLLFLDYHPIPIKSHISPDVEMKKRINQKPEPKIYLQSNPLINTSEHVARTTGRDVISGTGPWCNPGSFSRAVGSEQLATQPLPSTVPRRGTGTLRRLQAGGRPPHAGPPGYIEVPSLSKSGRRCWIGYQSCLLTILQTLTCWAILTANTNTDFFRFFFCPNRNMDNPALSHQSLCFSSKPGSDSSPTRLLWGLQTLRFSLHWMSVQAEEIPYVFNPKVSEC